LCVRLSRGGRLDYAPAGEVDHPISDRLGTVVLVRGEDDGTSFVPRACEDLVEQITTFLVKAGVRLVEEPKPSTPGN
jgi:hypothetical protein